MTTLAGLKIRTFRESQNPRLTRDQFAERYGGSAVPKASTIEGWENEGKRPSDSSVVNAIALAGIASHADWYRPALCPRCERRSDSPEILTCSEQGCPLAHIKAEAA
jgi:hypothetical protein